MSQISPAVMELESQIREMLGPSGGLSETRWVARLVDLMQVTQNIDGRLYLLKVLQNTPPGDKGMRFLQLGGVEILGNWIKEHKHAHQAEDKQVVQSILSSLNKLTITKEVLQETDIAKIVSSLKKALDSSIQAKASSILAKWEDMLEAVHTLKRPKRDDSQATHDKYVRWNDQESLVEEKFFWRTDEANAICASKRAVHPGCFYLPTESFQSVLKQEITEEAESNRKETERLKSLESQFESLEPRIFYGSLYSTEYLEMLVSNKEWRTQESLESQEEQSRQQTVLRVTYQREFDIPSAPQESPNSITIIDDTVSVIPGKTSIKSPPVAEPVYSAPNDLMKIQPSVSIMSSSAGYPYSYINSFMMGLGQPVPMYNQSMLMNNNTRPINFRTEACKNFHSPAGCTHGDNCHFIHDFEFEGRPIPNMAEWRKTNDTRRKNLEAMHSLQMGHSNFYTQPGPEPHN